MPKLEEQAPTQASGLEATVAPSGLEPTVAPVSGVAATVAPISGVEETAAPISGVEATVAPSASARVIVRAGIRADHRELVPVDPKYYSLDKELAKGGMGRIISGRDLRLGRPVAIKELLVSTGDLRARFEREARITARLQHPSIVNVIEAGTWPDGEPFFVMKLVQGKSLDIVIAGTRTLGERLALLPTVIAVVDALAYAHDRRIVHRDLKPANVLVGDFGETVVIDWGLAKDLSDDTDTLDLDVGPFRKPAVEGATLAGSVMGTPAYMPPEQARGEIVDERADVYSLGALLYHVLAGQAPYHARNAEELLRRVIDEAPPALAAMAPGTPIDLIAVVEKAMARERDQRYRTAKELAEELKRFQTGQLVGAHRYTTWTLVKRWLRRHRAIVGVSAAALSVIAVLSVIGIQRITSARDRAQTGEAAALEAGEVAERARDEARDRLSRQYEEQGRQQLLAGNAALSLVYLSEAYQLADRPSLRFLIARAMPALETRKIATTNAPLTDLAISSPDGTLLLTTSRPLPIGDNRALATVWRVADGTLVATLSGHSSPITNVAFSPDGKRVVTSSERVVTVTEPCKPTGGSGIFDGVSCPMKSKHEAEVILWDIASAKILAKLPFDTGIGQVGFVHDGRDIAVAAGGVTVWDATGKKLATLPSKRSRLGPRDRALLIDDNAASIVDIDHPSPPHGAFDPRMFRGAGMQFSPDGMYLKVDNHVLYTSGSVAATLTVSEPTFSPLSAFAGLTIATTDRDETVTIWNVATANHPQATLAGHTEAIRDIAYDAAGTRVLTASSDGTARLWDVVGGRTLAVLQVGKPVLAARFAGDRQIVIVTQGTIERWQISDHRDFANVGNDDDLHHDHDFSPDGTRVAIVNQQIAIWDVATGKLLVTVATDLPAERIAWSPDGKQLLVAARTGCATFDATTGKQIGELLTGMAGGVWRATWTGRGPRLITFGNNHVEIWDYAARRRLSDLAVKVHPDSPLDDIGDRVIPDDAPLRVVPLAGGAAIPLAADRPKLQVFSPRGDRVLVVDAATTTVFDTATGKPIAKLAGIQGELGKPTFSPDSGLVAAVDGKATRVWDATTGELRASFEGHREPPSSIAFSADGSRAVTAGFDNYAMVWDVRTGTRLATYGKHEHWVLDAEFTPDGSHIATRIARRGMLRLWDASLERRTAAEVARQVRCAVPLRLVDGRALPAPLACK